jgi:hypothetical protein
MKMKKPKVFYDKHGEYRWEYFFVGGKQKKRKVRTVVGIDRDDFIRNNVDEIWLHQEGYYEIINEREERNNESIQPQKKPLQGKSY